ncbi:uncharacterized protein IL334_001247 [Kwoniella shivajii]|uniref:RTA1 domain protein n=1 Tax=Kwoniella shivajii TaxID=564305 RepID=A0ABZ1CRE7_9TREE|nr:hypothetical protein IL334_001247 [Kwoniella shivajii]
MPYAGPIVNPPESGNAPFWQYGYVPSLPMGIIGVTSFMLISGPHLWWFVKKRGVRSVHCLFFFACLIEALGYGARLYSHTHEWSGMAFLLGIVVVQIATILITAGLYKAIQRGLKYMPDGQRLSPMRIRSMLTVCIILDVVWVFMQIAGQYYWCAAQASEIVGIIPTFALGTSTFIFLAGNVLQAITTIIIFVFCMVILKRSSRALTTISPETTLPHIKPLIIQVMISLGLFFVSLIMRIAEGAQGAYENAASHEVYFGVFEYLPIFAIIALWAIRPLHRFIFPFGHPRHHSQAPEIAITSANSAAEQTTKI